MLFLLAANLFFLIDAQDTSNACELTIPDSITIYSDIPISIITNFSILSSEVSLQKDTGAANLFITDKVPDDYYPSFGSWIYFSVYFNAVGHFSLRVTCGKNIESYSIYIKAPVLRLSIPDPKVKLHTGSWFTLFVQITDDYELNPSLIRYNNDTFTCSWEITTMFSTDSLASYIDGPTSIVTNSPRFEFQAIRIRYSGYLRILMDCTIAGGISSSMQIAIEQMPLKFLTLSMSTYQPTVYFEFAVTVKLYSEGYIPYFANTGISISEDSGSSIMGVTLASTEKGSHIFHVYFDSLGPKTIIAQLVGTIYPLIIGKSIVQVQPEFIKATINKTVTNMQLLPSPMPNAATVSLGIYDHTLTHIESANYNGGAYPITITIVEIKSEATEDNHIDGKGDRILATNTISGVTNAGIYTSAPFNVYYKGHYTVIVSSDAVE